MKSNDLITRALIQLQKSNPFWAYLSLYLKFKEIEKGKMLCDTMGVNCETGEVCYVKEYVEKLSGDELIGTIAHELNHIAFLTSLREENRNKIGWNFATDLEINSLLKNNNFKLPEGVLMPDYNDEFNTGTKKIKEVSKKTAEEIYDLLPKIKMKGMTYVVASGKGKGKELGKGFDTHIKGKGKDGKGLSPKEKRELEKNWKNKVSEAISLARMKGDIPAGLERLINNLHKEKIDWKALLSQYIMNSFPSDFTWKKPHRKSISVGTYLPDVVREGIEIVVGIDTSGSISEKDLGDFLSEIFGLCRAFQERLKMTLIPCDCRLGGVYEIENGNIEKIKKEVKITGGGGTEFKPVIDWIEENKRDTKLLIYLTDGYGEKVEKQPYDILWVLTKDGSDELIKDSGRVIRLED